MLHQMNLWHGPFVSIRSGKKDVELRLHDEKQKRYGVVAIEIPLL